MKSFTLRFEDEELHQAFRIKCIKKNSSMQKELLKLVVEYMNEDKKENK